MMGNFAEDVAAVSAATPTIRVRGSEDSFTVDLEVKVNPSISDRLLGCTWFWTLRRNGSYVKSDLSGSRGAALRAATRAARRAADGTLGKFITVDTVDLAQANLHHYRR
jgi:hypothetical protein